MCNLGDITLLRSSHFICKMGADNEYLAGLSWGLNEHLDVYNSGIQLSVT